MGHTATVSFVLKAHPDLDVNWQNPQGWTALHIACRNGNSPVVSLLLDHPRVNVNLQDKFGDTSLLLGCYNDWPLVVRILLKDPRVKATRETSGRGGWSPLWISCSGGYLEMLQLLIVSGKNLGDVSLRQRHFDGVEYTALEIARKGKKTEVGDLVERFMAQAEKTRFEVRVELGLVDEVVAELFAVIVFLCDDLFMITKPEGDALITATTIAAPRVGSAAPRVGSAPPRVGSAHEVDRAAAVRFFCMAALLPMELQMVLCHRVYGSSKPHILSKSSEVAFRALASHIL